LAVNLHGVPRFTADMDILVDLADAQNSLNLFQALKEIGYLPKVPVTAEQFSKAINRRNWMKQKNMVVFSFVNSKKPLSWLTFLSITQLIFGRHIKGEKLKKPVIAR
jgi:hypothetical protein